MCHQAKNYGKPTNHVGRIVSFMLAYYISVLNTLMPEQKGKYLANDNFKYILLNDKLYVLIQMFDTKSMVRYKIAIST